MDIEQYAAATLLDKGIKVRVTAPLLLRLFKKQTINLVIRQPYRGTLLRISLLYLTMNITDEQLENIAGENIHQLYTGHQKTMGMIAAQAILNGKWRGQLFGGILSRWLLWHLTEVQLHGILNLVVSLSGVAAFPNSIRLVRNMKMTAPNLSQTAQGS